MVRILFGVFMVAHGMVHLLYFGQARRLFELGAGMVWPDGNWAFTRLLGVEPSRMLASITCALAALLFAAGGIGLFARQVLVAACGYWRGGTFHIDLHPVLERATAASE